MRSTLYLVLISVLFVFCNPPQKEKKQIPELVKSENKKNLANVMKEAGLVNVQVADPTILVDLKYSSEDNFIKADVYGDLDSCYLRPIALEKLVKAHELLKKERPDLRFLVYDGARPRSVQQLFWDKLDAPDSIKSDYVANPKTGSVHNFGCAVDLTLIDKDGVILDMGTEFDDFGELAYPKYEDKLLKEGKLSDKQVENRKLLRRLMKEAGFSEISSEWWHFNAISRDSAKVLYGIIE